MNLLKNITDPEDRLDEHVLQPIIREISWYIVIKYHVHGIQDGMCDTDKNKWWSVILPESTAADVHTGATGEPGASSYMAQHRCKYSLVPAGIQLHGWGMSSGRGRGGSWHHSSWRFQEFYSRTSSLVTCVYFFVTMMYGVEFMTASCVIASARSNDMHKEPCLQHASNCC